MHTRKKILVFSDWFLPGFKAGGPIRSLANLVESLPFDFWIVTRITDHHSTDPYPGVLEGEWTQLRENVRVCYVEDSSMQASFVKEILLTESFDYIYFNSLFSPLFTLLPLRIARNMKLAHRCVLAPRGMLKPGALSIKARKKKIFLFVSRLLGWFSDIRWHATNEQEEKEIIKHYGRKSNVIVAPNLASHIDDHFDITHKDVGQLKLVSIARISSEKGILEALQFLKRANLKSGLECVFYGTQQDAAYLQQCKQTASEIEGAHITFPGEISPDEIPAALRKAHFFYMATWGENFGHAIAEALQHGKPAIISNRTPWRNLESVKAGWDLPLEPSFFTTVLSLCYSMTHEEYAVWSSGAREFGHTSAHNPDHVRAYYSLFA
jgi:glycosyltransferase involved in cell wall biosynthesis